MSAKVAILGADQVKSAVSSWADKLRGGLEAQARKDGEAATRLRKVFEARVGVVSDVKEF